MDKLKFRTPWYLGDKFAGFQYWEFEHGQVKLIGDYWEPWVSKRDELTAKPDEQCTGLKDEKDVLIYEGDRVRANVEKGYPCGETGGAMEGDIETITGYVRWDEGGGFVINRDNGEYELFGNILIPDDIEIIGNVHKKE